MFFAAFAVTPRWSYITPSCTSLVCPAQDSSIVPLLLHVSTPLDGRRKSVTEIWRVLMVADSLETHTVRL